MTDQTLRNLENTATNNISAEVTASEGLRRTLKIEAPSATVDSAFDAEYKKLQKSVTLKGFRKGKAPLSQIKQMYKGDVAEDVVNRLLQTSYGAALDKLDLNVAANPQIRAAVPLVIAIVCLQPISSDHSFSNLSLSPCSPPRYRNSWPDSITFFTAPASSLPIMYII